jgi:hypothetical protein
MIISNHFNSNMQGTKRSREEDNLSAIYKLINKETELEYSGPGEVMSGNLPSKRQRKAPSFVSGTDALKIKNPESLTTPMTVSPYYGEISKAGFQSILNWMKENGIWYFFSR